MNYHEDDRKDAGFGQLSRGTEDMDECGCGQDATERCSCGAMNCPDCAAEGCHSISCDCNRSLFFERAGGREPEGSEVGVCGEGRYRVEKIVRDDGTILYTEGRA